VPLADGRPLRGRTELGAVVSLRANGVPDRSISTVMRAHLAGSNRRVVVLTQGALLLQHFASTPIESCGDLAFGRTNPHPNVVANGLPRHDVLPGLVVADCSIVRGGLILQRVDVPQPIGLVEVLAQGRR